MRSERSFQQAPVTDTIGEGVSLSERGVRSGGERLIFFFHIQAPVRHNNQQHMSAPTANDSVNHRAPAAEEQPNDHLDADDVADSDDDTDDGGAAAGLRISRRAVYLWCVVVALLVTLESPLTMATRRVSDPTWVDARASCTNCTNLVNRIDRLAANADATLAQLDRLLGKACAGPAAVSVLGAGGDAAGDGGPKAAATERSNDDTSANAAATAAAAAAAGSDSMTPCQHLVAFYRNSFALRFKAIMHVRAASASGKKNMQVLVIPPPELCAMHCRVGQFTIVDRIIVAYRAWFYRHADAAVALLLMRNFARQAAVLGVCFLLLVLMLVCRRRAAAVTLEYATLHHRMDRVFGAAMEAAAGHESDAAPAPAAAAAAAHSRLQRDPQQHLRQQPRSESAQNTRVSTKRGGSNGAAAQGGGKHRR